MRIAFFTDTFLPQINGVATSIANFAMELGRRGHRILIITPKPTAKGDTFMADNVEVLYVPSLPAIVYPDFRMSPLIGLPKAFKALKQFDPDVIHFHTTLSLSIDALVMAKTLGKPLIGTNHIYVTRDHDDYLSFITVHPRIRSTIASGILFYSMLFYRACDVCIAPSTMLIEELRKSGIEKEFIHLPNAISPLKPHQLSPAEATALQRTYGLRKNVIVHVGRLSREKYVDDLLRSFALLRGRHDETSLLVIGDGPDRDRLERLTNELDIRDDVVFTGFIPNRDLFSSGLLSIADLFVSASPMESQGMVFIEAMAFGLPIVAVSSGAAPEVIGHAGIYARPHDITELTAHMEHFLYLQSSSEREEIHRRSRERAAAFSAGALTDRLLRIYEGAIDKNR